MHGTRMVIYLVRTHLTPEKARVNPSSFTGYLFRIFGIFIC